MAPNLASFNAHTTAFLALLPAFVGDGEKPAGKGWQGVPGSSSFEGYGICYPISSSFDGSIAEGQDDAELTWQVTCVGATRAQAEAVTDLVVDAAVGAQLTVTGRATTHVELQSGSAGCSRQENEQQPPLWMSTPRFTVTSTPA